MFKKYLGLFSTFVLLTSFAMPAQASGTEPMLVPVENDEALFVLSEDDWAITHGSMVGLQPYVAPGALNVKPWIWCESVDDPACDFNKPGFSGFADLTLPVCENAGAENCVSEFGIELDGTYYPGEFVSTLNVGKTTGAKPNLNLYRGGLPSLFKVAQVPHEGGDLYLVRPWATLNLEANNKFRTNDFYLNVIPVKIEPASVDRGPRIVNCIWIVDGGCGVRANFNLESKPVVELRLTNQVGGWFLGRMKDPTLTVEKFSNRNNTVRVSAYPVEVARFAHKMKKSAVTLADKKATGNSGGLLSLESDGPARIFNTGYDNSNFGMLRYFRSKVNDTAVGKSTIFLMRTTSMGDGNPCLSDRSRVLGIVTTNSMAYDGFAPRFNKGFLDYRVAGLHFEPDGKTKVVGSYDLVMRSDVARCLYRFSNAPVSASITIAGEGDKSIATTIVGERNGWLKLAAYGFTFSQKTIKVKLTQKRTTITCVSNSNPAQSRKVAGLSPKCPSGFKKK